MVKSVPQLFSSWSRSSEFLANLFVSQRKKGRLGEAQGILCQSKVLWIPVLLWCHEKTHLHNDKKVSQLEAKADR